MVSLYDYYLTPKDRNSLKELLNFGAQNHLNGLRADFLEKDLWVTEILRLLFDEGLLGGHMKVAFKGGTALSKCWRAIERFSEDIDLSIHWSDLAESSDEAEDWEKTTKNKSQNGKFRSKQSERLEAWTKDFTQRLNDRLARSGIKGLYAEVEDDSGGEKVQVHFPSVSDSDSRYLLAHVLLEFGGRNRGKPTDKQRVTSYLSEVPGLPGLNWPEAEVAALEKSYILWEKLTALHQFSTQDKEPKPTRLARHWYDVDRMVTTGFPDPLDNEAAMRDVIDMKSARFAQPGVDYKSIHDGNLSLIPSGDRLAAIQKDHEVSITAGFFFGTPDSFESIITRLKALEGRINESLGK